MGKQIWERSPKTTFFFIPSLNENDDDNDDGGPIALMFMFINGRSVLPSKSPFRISSPFHGSCALYLHSSPFIIIIIIIAIIIVNTIIINVISIVNGFISTVPLYFSPGKKFKTASVFIYFSFLREVFSF